MPSYKGRRYRITPEERKREIDRMKDIYDNAPQSIKEVLSDFRAHVEEVWPCNRARAYKLIAAFVEEYQVEFVLYRRLVNQDLVLSCLKKLKRKLVNIHQQDKLVLHILYQQMVNT